MIDYLNLYERMHDNNIMLAFKGEVSFDLVNSVLKIMEERLDKVETVDEYLDSKTSLLLIESDDKGYHVVTGNYVTNDKIDRLKERIDEVNSVSKEELRDLYKKILNNDQFSDKGGAGLGFIDIARKSGQKLNYNFQPVKDNYSFFSLLINIQK